MPTTRLEGANLLPEIWAKEVGLSATQRRVLAALCERVDFAGPGDLMNFEQLGDITATRTATGAALAASLTFTDLTITQRQVEPLMAWAAVQLDRDLTNKWLPSSEAAVQKRLGISLANQMEITIATDMVTAAVGFSNTQIGNSTTDFTLTNFLEAVGTVWTNGGDLVTQGVDRLYGVFHPAKWNNVVEFGLSGSGSGNFLSAAVMGVAGGPAQTGRLRTVFGVDIDFTGHIQTGTIDALAGAHNIVFAEGSSILAMKEEPEIVIEPFELTTKVIGVVDYGFLVLWRVLGIEYITSTT